MSVNKLDTLAAYGEEFEKKVVRLLMADTKYFEKMEKAIDQNMFGEPLFRVWVGLMKNYYHKYNNSVPSYSTMDSLLHQHAHNEIEVATYTDLLKEVRDSDSDGVEYVKDQATRFFKMKYILKASTEMREIALKGDLRQLETIQKIFNKASAVGQDEYDGVGAGENPDAFLSDDYRTPIPTGFKDIDDILDGGIGKGEVMVLIGPSSFGKVQPNDTKVVTPSGYKNMGDIKVGDYVIGKNGKPTKVIGVFPHKKWDFYKVTFSDGVSTECGKEHLWNVSKLDEENYKTVDLDFIMNQEDISSYKIPMCSPVDIINEESFEKRWEKIEDYLDGKIKLSNNELHFLVYSLGLTIIDSKVIANYSRTFKSIEFSRTCDGQCIKVDSEDELYLTDDFIVTHNTSMTTGIASNAASYKCEDNNNQGYKVLQIVFEDHEKQIQRKHAAKICQIESRELSKPNNIDNVRHILSTSEDYKMVCNNVRILRLPTGEKTAWDIERIIKRIINKGFDPDLVIIDYFECLDHPKDSTMDKWELEGKTMRKFEAMSNEMNKAFCIPLQGTKDSVNAEIVSMDKAGGSFRKIQIAHIVMSIARGLEDIANNRATLSILKNRSGKAGTTFTNAYFNNGTCTVDTSECQQYNSMFDFDQHQQKTKDSTPQDAESRIAQQMIQNRRAFQEKTNANVIQIQ